MLGPRITTVFASRWRALWWAGSMLLLAWSVVPSADESGGAKTEKAKPAHVDPWAKDAPTDGAEGAGATSP
jgi:hypothetical protein